MRRKKGTGSVVKIRNQYRARWTIGKQQIYKPARETRDEAERDRLEGPPIPESPQKPAHNQFSDASAQPFGRFVLQCLRGGYGQSLRKNTLATNHLYRRTHINPSPLADLPLNQIRPSDVENWVAELRVKKTRKVDGETVTTYHLPAPATVHRIYALVAKIFALAVRDDLIDRSPCRSIRLPEIPERKNRILSPDETFALVEPSSAIDAALILGVSGFSRSEVLALKWDDVKWDENLIRVPGEKNWRRDRIIPLTSLIRDALAILDPSTEYVITNARGKQFDPNGFSRQAKARMIALGLPPETRFQDLRGTFITQLLELKINPKTVMNLVGHSQIKTTMKSYARPRNEIAAEAMAEQLNAIGYKKPVEKQVDENR